MCAGMTPTSTCGPGCCRGCEPGGEYDSGDGFLRRMVIMHVVAPGEFGGLVRVVQMLGRGLRGLGHDVHVLAVAVGKDTAQPFLAPLAEAGVSTRTLAVRGRGYLDEHAAIAGVFRHVSPD